MPTPPEPARKFSTGKSNDQETMLELSPTTRASATVIGTEIRTGETFAGQPVFRQYFYKLEPTNGVSLGLDSATTFNQIIRVAGYQSVDLTADSEDGYPIPYTNGTIHTSVLLVAGTLTLERASTAAVDSPYYITVDYTKTV